MFTFMPQPELSSGDWDQMGCKAEKIWYLVLYRKSVPFLPVTTVEYPEIGMSVQSVKVGPQLEGNCQPQIGTCQEDLPATEQQQQGQLPSASAEVEPRAAEAANLQPPWGEFRVGSEALSARGIQCFSRHEEMQGLGSWSQFLKTSSYLKFCSYVPLINHNFPALQGCIHPVLPQEPMPPAWPREGAPLIFPEWIVWTYHTVVRPVKSRETIRSTLPGNVQSFCCTYYKSLGVSLPW